MYSKITTRNELAELFYRLGYTLGVEIGVKEGEFSEVLLKANKDLFLYSVDMWGNSRRELRFYKNAVDRLKPYNNNILRMKSEEAVILFGDSSLDFVYIDAAHDFDNTLQDITLWSKKVRKGGIVAGHDFVRYARANYGVIEAVIQYTTEHNIKFYVTHADTWKSYFWVKEG